MRSARLIEMRDYIRENEFVSIEDLCSVFPVSMYTIRRDLTELQKQGQVTKVYGGVRYNHEKMNLIDYTERGGTNIEQKKRIARRASELLEDNDVVFFDTGTTTHYVLDYLEGKRLTILTANLDVINKAVYKDNIKLVVLPGTYERRTNSITGNEVMEYMSRYNLTKAIMAASGITIECGVTHAAAWENADKRMAVQRAKEVILLIDAAKFDKVALMTYCNLDEIDAVVTDEVPEEDYTKYFKEHQIELLVAK